MHIQLGDRLSELRKDHGYTQDYIAELLKVARSSVSAYETGANEPSLENLIKLANLYNVSLDYLCCRTKEKYNLYLDDKDFRDFILEFYDLTKNYKILKK